MQLQFKGVYRPLILAGRKTQTLRATMPRGARVGAPLTLMNGYRADATFARATIIAVDTVTICDLTAADARADGFADLTALRVALASTYPTARTFCRVRWSHVVPT